MCIEENGPIVEWINCNPKILIIKLVKLIVCERKNMSSLQIKIVQYTSKANRLSSLMKQNESNSVTRTSVVRTFIEMSNHSDKSELDELDGIGSKHSLLARINQSSDDLSPCRTVLIGCPAPHSIVCHRIVY